MLTKSTAALLMASLSLHANEIAKASEPQKEKYLPISSSTPYYYNANTNYAYAFGEWLYWKPVTGQPLLWEFDKYTVSPNMVGQGTAIQDYTFSAVNYEFSSGYRVGGGIRSKERMIQNQPISPWQFEFIWTRIFNEGKNHISVPGNLRGANPQIFEYVQNLIDDINTNNPIEATSRAWLNQNRMDAYFAWPIWVTQNTILRLSTGATYAWFKNVWSNNYINADFSGVPSNLSGFGNADLEWKYYGGGLFGGGDIYVPFGLGFGLYANSNFALTFGTVKEEETYYSHQTNSDPVLSRSKYRFYAFQPNIAFGAGADFKRWIYDTVLLHFAIGWEFNWWFNLNRFSNPFQPLNQLEEGLNYPQYFIFEPTDLGYHGLNMRLGLDY